MGSSPIVSTQADQAKCGAAMQSKGPRGNAVVTVERKQAPCEWVSSSSDQGVLSGNRSFPATSPASTAGGRTDDPNAVARGESAWCTSRDTALSTRARYWTHDIDRDTHDNTGSLLHDVSVSATRRPDLPWS